MTKWYFTLLFTSVLPCWQQRTHDQVVFYSVTYFVVALLTTEDTLSNGILLYYLLRCGLVDNRGHMTKWYCSLLLTSLWPCSAISVYWLSRLIIIIIIFVRRTFRSENLCIKIQESFLPLFHGGWLRNSVFNYWFSCLVTQINYMSLIVRMNWFYMLCDLRPVKMN